jgi:Cysteine-rich CPXCG
VDDDTFDVTCPYCGEDVTIHVESDVRRTFVQDCEICCNPWPGLSDPALRIVEQSYIRLTQSEPAYVWDERMINVENNQVRESKKHGWYEHG